ncbi:MAG: hypothetical protein IJ192_05555, partial [Clostridia bacterium]|nr:hypothetical protein [Clostridia bacterium]
MAYNKFDNYYRDENGNVHRDIPLGTSPQDAYARTNKRLKEEIQRIDERIDETNNNTKTEVEQLEKNITGASDIAKNQLDNAVEKFSNNIGNLTERFDSDIAAINNRIDTTVDTVNASINTEINKVNHRVDNIIANSTATEGNSELIDVRIGNDGIVYESAGAAVRGQIVGINNSAVFCADHRVTSSVDEYYDANNVPPGKIIAYGNSG